MEQKNETPNPPAPPKIFSWQIHGECMHTAPDDLVLVQEQECNLDWVHNPNRCKPKPIGSSSPTHKKFGKPIDINLAVSYMAEGFEQVRGHFFEGKDKVDPHLDSILRLNYGITYDKSVILKILSQPKCEGLRSYLIHRPTPLPDGEPNYSLVMIGVDAEGYDLNYYEPEGQAEEKSIANSQMPNQALLVEYGHPPGLVNLFTHDVKPNEHYVVLRYARHLVDVQQ